MILNLQYKIRFPLGANFSLDPKFIFIKQIYTSIKKITCQNINCKCKECSKKEKCIYYLLSGEDFIGYPSILINRNFVEKKQVNKNEVIKLNFYLIGVATEYAGFITNYFDLTSTIFGNYFQNFLVERIYLDESKTIDGNIKLSNPLQNVLEINEMVEYYNNKYMTKYHHPKVEIVGDNNIIINDYTKYNINHHFFKYSGIKYLLNVNNFSRTLLDTGVGKLSFMGGGLANEN